MSSRVDICAQLPRRMAACLLVSIYLGACSPFAAPLALAAGLVEHGHSFLPGVGRDGAPVVVLHHTMSSTDHRHGFLARTLTLFEKKGNTPGSDHVLELPGLAQCLKPEISDSVGDEVGILSVALCVDSNVLREDSLPSPAPGSPTKCRSPLLFLRSAQLLI